jgi:DTW domain-containing protein YfiP
LVVLLLHPKEVNQAKGTLPLLVNSLTRSQVIIGENFTHNDELDEILQRYGEQVALLYPSEKAEALLVTNEEQFFTTKAKSQCKCLILLDATWKKAYRMYQLSSNLHAIRHFSLPENLIGQYQIRKTMKKNALSTLEACCYALNILEHNNEKLLVGNEKLLNNFVKFNQFQLSFRPK